MKTVTKKVRHKTKVVAEIDVPVYDNVQEIVDSEPDERIIAVFNNGNHVRLMGNERAKHSGVRTGKKLRNRIAFETLTIDEIMSCQGDGVKLEQLLDSPEIQARIDVKIAETSDDTSEAATEGEE